MPAEQLEAIRAVHQASLGLTLACTEYVGPLSMAISLSSVRALGEPLPRQLRRDIDKIEQGEKRS